MMKKLLSPVSVEINVVDSMKTVWEENDVHEQFISTLHNLAVNVIQDLEDYDAEAFKWATRKFAGLYGEISEEKYTLYYKDLEILSYTKINGEKTSTFTPSISFEFLGMLGKKNLGEIIDYINYNNIFK
jgi:hypothetical protein